jgi:hypothetical protein
MKSRHNIGALAQQIAHVYQPDWIFMLGNIDKVGESTSKDAELTCAAFDPTLGGVLLGFKLAMDPEFMWSLLEALEADRLYNLERLRQAPTSGPVKSKPGQSKADATAAILALIGGSKKSSME